MSFRFNYSSDSCQPITLGKGRYLFEVWGAEGGDSQGIPIYGGFSSGIYSVTWHTTLYVCIGGKGICATDDSCRGGFNGGGNGKHRNTSPCCGGGGSTDIRKIENDVESRLIVAGGGGGSGYYNINYPGGVGGGTIGGTGNGHSQTMGHGGSTTGGLGGYWNDDDLECTADSGRILDGGNGCSKWAGSSGGGGGGYYGGGGGADVSGGGGGSGYVDPVLFHKQTLNGNQIQVHTIDGNGFAIIHPLFPPCTSFSLRNMNLFILFQTSFFFS